MYFTSDQIIQRKSAADTNAVYQYITSNPGIDATGLAAWASQNLPDPQGEEGRRLTYAIASLQQQGKLYDITGGWIPQSG